MYFKMAFNNVKKSFKDYMIYFFTITFAVCIFYSFNSINNQTIMGEINEIHKQYVDIMNQFISILSVGVSVILGCLIIYATNFIIKRRKKEFGIYMLLGMKKRSMSVILFLETLYIGFISLVVGLILGLILAQVLSVFTARLFVIEMTKYTFVISSQAIVKTITYFGFMYILVMIFNIFIVAKYKLIDLLYANKKNESIKLRNMYVSLGVLIVSIFVIGYAYYCINISGLDFKRKEFVLSIGCGVLGTLMFFYGISSVLLNILQKKSNMYFNKLNCFIIRQICSKFNTNFISMTIICLMLLVTIGTLACSLTIKNFMEDDLNQSMLFDGAVEIRYNGHVKNGESLIQVLKNEGCELGQNDDYIEFKTYKDESLLCSKYLEKYVASDSSEELLENDFFNFTEFIKVSDFNNIRKFSNEDTIELKDNEVLVSCNYKPLINVAEDFVKNEKTIDINGENYNIKENELMNDYNKNFFRGTIGFLLIVPDSVVENNENAYLNLHAININFKGADKKNKEKKLTEILNRCMKELSENIVEGKDSYYLTGATRQMYIDNSKGISTLILFISIYIGIVFLLVSVTVLALQQLSSCNESIDRYGTLRKIGATNKMINKSILYQVGVFFLFPLLLAVVHSVVGIRAVINYLIKLGTTNMTKSILVTVLVMVIGYGGYLYATYVSYKNVINNDLN
ncbi:MAG: ABC transporter permease [Clostridium butyricum]|nr:ABC transporter permease [Clostridium butyricum]